MLRKVNTLYLLLAVLPFLHTRVYSQVATFEISEQVNPGHVLGSTTQFLDVALPLATTEHNFNIKNTSPTTQSISIKKSENLLHTVSAGDKAEAFFCTGVTCYASHIFTGAMVLNPGELAVFKAQLIEASVAGESNISYKFSNNTTNESTTIILKYNSQITSFEKQNLQEEIPNSLKIYTDANSGCLLVNSETNIDNATIYLTDLNGTTVYSSKISLTDTQNHYRTQTINYSSGIYLVKIVSETNTYHRKIVLIK